MLSTKPAARPKPFRLTGAVLPRGPLAVVPVQGYRLTEWRDPAGTYRVPVLIAQASAELLPDLFLDLLDVLGEEVDLVLETSHDMDGEGHRDLHREGIDLPVLKSACWEFEDVLVRDGYAGIAVLNQAELKEVQFSEHKALIIYSADTEPFEEILWSAGLTRNDDLPLISEGEHVHVGSEELARRFGELACCLGAETYETDS